MVPKLKRHKSFFFDNPAPAPHKGWTIEAFQDYCRAEMEAAGFDLRPKISCRYDPRSGFVVFWQELEDVAYPYSLN